MFPSREQLLQRKVPILIAEVGINHNGDIKLAKKLIDVASAAGFDYVKFQKRNIDLVYSSEELKTPRDSHFGKTNGDLKRGLEFDREKYFEIDSYCKEKGIGWFASPWDTSSVDFLEEFQVPVYKVASALLTNSTLLRKIGKTERPVIMSTGMSTLTQIQTATEVLIESGTTNLTLLHCVASYPAKNSELNLSVIETLRGKFNFPIGYSGHEVGIMPSVVAAVKFGAVIIERHVTIDRSMWGTDQAASLEPQGMFKLVKYIQEGIEALGSAEKRVIDSEIPIMEKLRKVTDF